MNLEKINKNELDIQEIKFERFEGGKQKYKFD